MVKYVGWCDALWKYLMYLISTPPKHPIYSMAVSAHTSFQHGCSRRRPHSSLADFHSHSPASLRHHRFGAVTRRVRTSAVNEPSFRRSKEGWKGVLPAATAAATSSGDSSLRSGSWMYATTPA